MHRTKLLLVSLAALLAAGAAAAASPTLERIKSTGTIVFGYRDGAAPFSARQRNGQVRGYTVELCEKVAAAVGRALGVPNLKVEWKPVDSETRLADVVSHKVDAECGTTTITLSRMERVDFSVPIFVDGGSALVRAGRNAPTTVGGLAGKRIAVMPATTTETALRKALSVTGADATFVQVKDGAEGVAALLAGKVDAYASDRMLLAKLRIDDAKGNDLAFLENDFSYEPYGIALPRDDSEFRLLVNRTLIALFKSGEIDPIFIRWLSPYGNPGALLNAMFYLNSFPE
ncbi:MAG TPA: amino acid ABC transporter substrate-binding protein [Casimicrobiaceae bacterium]|nr:amino acid ABC transporter substrate-binding protein [Casimicrobiaceae bacterium]